MEPVSDVEAGGDTYSDVVASINAFLKNENISDVKQETPLTPTLSLLFPTLKQYESMFFDVFPKFKLGAPISRWVMPTKKTQGHYCVRVPFVWSEYEIPRFGILVYEIKPAFYGTWETEFSPFLSEPRKDQANGVDWVKLYYLCNYPPLRTLGRAISSAVSANPPVEIPPQLDNSQSTSPDLLEHNRLNQIE